MHFKQVLLASTFASSAYSAAVPGNVLGNTLVARHAAPEAEPTFEQGFSLVNGNTLVARDANPDPTFGLGLGFGFGLSSSCPWWNPFCTLLQLTSYSCGGINFNVYARWSQGCNMVQFGQLWNSYTSATFSLQSSLSADHLGAFAQAGIQLSYSANFNANVGWYGTSKSNWIGFCNDIQNHYKTKQPCSQTQWTTYKKKWSVDETRPCSY